MFVLWFTRDRYLHQLHHTTGNTHYGIKALVTNLEMGGDLGLIIRVFYHSPAYYQLVLAN